MGGVIRCDLTRELRQLAPFWRILSVNFPGAGSREPGAGSRGRRGDRDAERDDGERMPGAGRTGRGTGHAGRRADGVREPGGRSVGASVAAHPEGTGVGEPRGGIDLRPVPARFQFKARASSHLGVPVFSPRPRLSLGFGCCVGWSLGSVLAPVQLAPRLARGPGSRLGLAAVSASQPRPAGCRLGPSGSRSKPGSCPGNSCLKARSTPASRFSPQGLISTPCPNSLTQLPISPQDSGLVNAAPRSVSPRPNPELGPAPEPRSWAPYLGPPPGPRAVALRPVPASGFRV
jgi:hypothetical protein